VTEPSPKWLDAPETWSAKERREKLKGRKKMASQIIFRDRPPLGYIRAQDGVYIARGFSDA
jgi:hypothetical protein